jgi:hypothetical protein
MAYHGKWASTLLALALSGAAVGASGQAAELVRSQYLMDAPSAKANALVSLAAKAQVEVLERRGGWSRVRADNREGWLRVLALRETREVGGLDVNLQALNRPDKNAFSRVTSVAGLRGMPTQVVEQPSAHALILTIGAYQEGIPPLKGVVYDAESAALMARALGVPEKNIVSLSDSVLTLAGIRKALDALEARILPHDEVFFYYSGHGTRLLVNDAQVPRCAEALLSVNGEVLLDAELEQRLHRIAEKARRMVVFFDACHSGGVSTRSVGDSRFTPKSFDAPGIESCNKPANALTRSLQIIDVDEDMGKGKRNFVHVAAARADEAALDDESRGGLATQAWLECLGGGAKDLDGSTGLSVSELQACAQPFINEFAGKDSGFSPPHLMLTGNVNMVLLGAEELPSSINPAAVLGDIFANRDDRRRVRLRADKPAYKVKHDRVTFSLESSHAGYVYILMAGSDGKSFDLLFPNKKDSRNQIQANEIWQLPRAGWAFRAGGPAGSNQLLALVSDKPRHFDSIGMKPAGPFSMISASPVAGSQILSVSSGLAQGGEGLAVSECAISGKDRTAEIATACSNAYGADQISLVEIN